MSSTDPLLLNFQRTYAGSVRIEQIKQVVFDCKLCVVSSAGSAVGKLFFGDDFSILAFAESLIKITRRQRIFKKNIYSITNVFTQETLGDLTYPFWLSYSKIKCKASFSNGDIYSLNQKSDLGGFLTPKTKRVFRYEMAGQEDQFFYTGRLSYTRKRFFPRKEEQIFSGEIELSNAKRLLPVMIGLYIIEESFRLEEENTEK